MTTSRLRLSWSRRWTLAAPHPRRQHLDVALVALSTLYLDIFRNRLSQARRGRRNRGDRDGRRRSMCRRCRRPRSVLRDDLQVDRQPAAPVTGPTASCWPTAGAVRPDLRAARSDHRELDQGCRALARPRLRLRSSAPSRRRLSSSRRPTGSQAGPRRSPRRSERQAVDRGPQRARRDAGYLRRGAGRRRRAAATVNARDFTTDGPQRSAR